MTTTDFDKIIWRDALTFVDFFATWCGPCQMMHPAIDKFQREMNGRVDVYKVDIDDRGMLDAVHRYNIMSVPTLMFFRRGEVLWRESGRVGYDHLVNVLRELEKNMEGYQNSVKTVMRAASARRLRGIIGPVSSILSVEPGREVAIETALGGALQNIVAENEAAAKAGIIKPGCPVVSYGGAPEADAVLRRVAAQQHAPFTEVDFAKLQITGGDLDAVTFSFDGLDGVRLPLIGSYQPRNAALAITALRVLRQQGWNIPESAIRAGLEQVSWPGRFELLRHSPAFVLDGSHNAHGMRATVQSLKDRFPGQKFVFLVSIMADKDVDEMLALLAPLAERFVTVTAHNPRAMPAQTLAEHIRAYGCTAEAADSIEAGVARAEELGGEGPVCALGTLYFSGDVRQAFAKINKA